MSGLRLTPYAALEEHIARREAVDAETLAAAARIVDEVRRGGDEALRRLAGRHDGLGEGEPPILERGELQRALDAIAPEDRAVLERTAKRIRTFAEAQREALCELDVAIDGGRAGHSVAPVERAGCYAPGGGYPLPSSVLMTAVTARAAGVREVIAASPRPGLVMRAAAAIAEVDALVCAGGAHAIAALAYGTGTIPAVDVIAGPGSRWVTAAKQLVAGRVGIDMLAGPSELVVLADESADAELVAADLLAQAEHAPDALPILVTTDRALVAQVDEAIAVQLADLPTADVARRAIANGFAVLCGSLDEAIAACDRLAPEHLEVMTADPERVASRLSHYGALFVGAGSAEVLGDYGAGPNHVLPTGGTARFSGGLSVLTFTRVRTWLRVDSARASGLLSDAAALARLEGLEAHARAASRRR